MQKFIGTLQSGRRIMGESISGGRWLNAHEDRSAGLSPLSSQCLALCDASGTGDHVLVIAETRISKKSLGSDESAENIVNVTGRLRTYRGAASLSSERPLQGPPCAVLAFYTDDLEPRVPAVAVAIGTDVLIYKNSKPFFKWSAPPLATTALEQDIWRRLIAPEDQDSSSISAHLSSLRSIPFAELSPRSQQLLTMKEKEEEYIGRYIHSEIPSRPSIITCLAFLKKMSTNPDSVACLVVATETGQLYILDPVSLTPLQESATNRGGAAPTSAPANLVCSGLYDVEFRCWVGLRNGSVWMVRRGWVEGRKWCQAPQNGTILELLVLQDNTLIMALSDGRIIAFSKKAKTLWTIHTGPSPLSCVCLVPLPHLNKCLLAAGINSQLQLYENRSLVDIIHLSDRPVAAKFGRLGQEDNVFSIVTHDGSLFLKILKRIAEFNANSSLSNDSVNVVSKPLPLPKRSKLFAEQAQRERNNAQSMHQIFQQGLIRLRLTAARNTVLGIHTDGKNVADSASHPVKLSAQVLGLGPKFTLTLTLENLSSDKSVSNLSIVLHTSINKYQIKQPFAMIPMIPPELFYKIETSVTEILETGNFENTNEEFNIPIRVFVMVLGQVQPVLAASIHMPPTDPLAFLV